MWTCQQTEMQEDSERGERAGIGKRISDDTGWRIRLDMREAEAMAASEHEIIAGEHDTLMETQSSGVATPAADSCVIQSKFEVLGRVQSYKLKSPAPFDGDDLQHHEERGRQVQQGQKLNGQRQSQEGIEKFWDDELSGWTFEMLSGAVLPNLTIQILRNNQRY